jgi:hypothetical protein
MEVHHHPEVEKKGIKEYLLEGLMIFLAVTLGFFAESLRENINKNERELGYIRSFVADLREDTTQLAQNLEDNSRKMQGLDKLLAVSGSDFSDAAARRSLYLFSNAISRLSRFSSNDATMQQLMHSGGMQFIRKSHIADSIARYDQAVRDIYAAEIPYAKATNDGMDAMSGLIYFTLGTDSSKNREYHKRPFPILLSDPQKLQLFFNKVSMERGWTQNYLNNLQRIIPFQNRLIALLKNEYDLD